MPHRLIVGHRRMRLLFARLQRALCQRIPHLPRSTFPQTNRPYVQRAYGMLHPESVFST